MSTSATLYVAAVAVAAAVAFTHPGGGWTLEALVLLATLPALLPLLPVVYVVGASAWNLTGADHGGPLWPVALTYGLVFAGIALADVWLLRSTRRWWSRRRAVLS